MKKQSAGILVYRVRNKLLEVLLVHPGGPFWKNKDAGAWSIPKGEFGSDEDPLLAARREFEEEVGQSIEGSFVQLQSTKMKSGKIIFCWAVNQELDVTEIKSNHFRIEWPPHSGKLQEFPEVDKAEWMDVQQAIKRINPAQISFINQLVGLLKS